MKKHGQRQRRDCKRDISLRDIYQRAVCCFYKSATDGRNLLGKLVAHCQYRCQDAVLDKSVKRNAKHSNLTRGLGVAKSYAVERAFACGEAVKGGELERGFP